MRSHPKKGQPVKIANGPLQGRYFIVTEYLTTQFQGKSIEKIVKVHEQLIAAMKNRGYPVDEDVVFGKLYPEMKPTCVHDKELQVEMRAVATDGGVVELPPNVESIGRKPKRTKKSKKENPDDAS